MARGLATPMPVIMIGVIGGMIAYGIVGLFFGPVVLAIAWAVLGKKVMPGRAAVAVAHENCIGNVGRDPEMSMTRQCLQFILILIAAILSWLVPERKRAKPQGEKAK
jgi:hypothetical protein